MQIKTASLVSFGGILIIISAVKGSTSQNDERMKERRQGRSDDEFAMKQVSSGFGYAIHDEESKSNQFRQEQRDPNGVVRGSYGFKNPSGSFRLVNYVADDKGFRAHISTNEHGIGQQNPASVGINYLVNSPLVSESQFSIKTPISKFDRTYSNENQMHETSMRSNYDHYTPFKTTNSRSRLRLEAPSNSERFPEFDQRMQLQRNAIPTNLRNEYTDYSKDEQASNQEIPGERVSSAFRIRVPSVPSSSMNNPYGLSRNTEKVELKMKDNVLFMGGSPNTQFMNEYENVNYPVDHRSFTPNNIRNSDHVVAPYYLYQNSLRQKPMQKVHNSLPDCSSASSAELCKPPLLNFLSHNGVQLNVPTDMRINMQQEFKNSLPRNKPEVDMEEEQNKLGLSTEFDYSNSGILPHLIPHSFSFRPETSSQHFNVKYDNSIEHKQNEDACRKKHLNRGSVSNDVSEEALESYKTYVSRKRPEHPFHNSNRKINYVDIQTLLERTPLLYLPQSSAFNSIKRSSVDNSQNLLIVGTQNSNRQERNLQNFNLLGFIILPKEEDVRQITPENKLEDALNSSFMDDSRTDGPEVTGVEEEFEAKSTTESQNDSFLMQGTVSHDLNYNPQNSVQSTFDQVSFSTPNSSGISNETNNSETQLHNSKFLILEDKENFDNSTSQNPSNIEKNVSSGDSSDNWRKVLEAEIEQEYKETSLQRQRDYHDLLPNPPSSGTAEEQRILNLQKPKSPLYDSRGVPIKPENVPLHLHRYVPPTAMTSLPWKFSIPRPEPPRSIVVPPKPPVFL